MVEEVQIVEKNIKNRPNLNDMFLRQRKKNIKRDSDV